jgi:hypothetical protein
LLDRLVVLEAGDGVAGAVGDVELGDDLGIGGAVDAIDVAR